MAIPVVGVLVDHQVLFDLNSIVGSKALEEQQVRLKSGVEDTVA